MRGLFLYNPSDLNSTILGGVQICSQEFLKIIKETVNELHFFEVQTNRSLLFRVLFKLNLDTYQSYNPTNYKTALINSLIANKITHVFINKSELIKFSKLIKEAKLDFPPKIIIMSHGNESGDLLGDLSGNRPRFKGLLKFFGIIKLGIVLYLESRYRRKYVDLVCTMSEEESAIEKWLGINNPIFIPRLINKGINIKRSPIPHVFGYVGTLNHTPNIAALYDLCEKLLEENLLPELRIVGQPAEFGRNLEKKYPFVRYLGPLSDTDLFEEVKKWSFFINPIFNYSRGASMKLAKAIEWEIPIITTTAGRRGYLINEEKLIETANTPQAMVTAIKQELITTTADYKILEKNICSIKETSPTVKEISLILKKYLFDLN